MSHSLDPVITARAVVAGNVTIARTAVVGVLTRFVPATVSRDVAVVCAATGGLLAAICGIVALRSDGAGDAWVPWCLAIAATGFAVGGLLRSTAPRAAAHWAVDILTAGGPATVYWSSTAVDAERVARQLAAALVPQ